MKITRPSYYESHNYSTGIDGGWWEKLKPYLVWFLLTAFYVYSVAGAVHWGQGHCHKQAVKSIKPKAKHK